MLDSHDAEQYLVRTRPRKDERPKIGWVNSCFLEKKSTNIGQVSNYLSYFMLLLLTHITVATTVVVVVVAAAAVAVGDISTYCLTANDKAIFIESKRKYMDTKRIVYSSVFSTQYIYLHIIWYVRVRK